MRLKDKIAIVTGGGVGIGRAYCLALAREGAKVVAADIQDGEAKRVAEEIKQQGGEAIAVPVDVTSEEKTRAMADAALARYGRIDILVNNAALYSAIKKKPFMEIEVEEWDRVMAVNVKGLFLCMQAVYPAMKRQGKGKVINISSGTALGGTPFYLHYVTSKAGVIGFTRALARELGGDNICVNAITPGLTLSSPQQEGTLTPEQLADRRKKRSFQRDQKPDDLVGTVIFLASDDSDFITGQTINVDGGANMY
ncbi:MAG TPA: 3-oxoacyl-ACP reductase family protein [Verrucomicrobiae bacterium]|jgi:3-oxoacyl-[acyl-carrier protein] reductase|nr:3-oxoacyl-ACP reductase family protein [Verrucomicrobiae bacterium]